MITKRPLTDVSVGPNEAASPQVNWPVGRRSHERQTMAIVNMREMLCEAQRGSYAVGASNILNSNSMRAVVDAATKLAGPVIIQTSLKTVLFWG